jgi:tRNA G18 (ribose-2'-O)-methylase SpoU
LTPSGDVDLDELSPQRPGRIALLLGAEGPGLTAAVLAEAEHRARISLAPGVDSLNVATAAAVALHALRRLG